jgi:hypothetical protein
MGYVALAGQAVAFAAVDRAHSAGVTLVTPDDRRSTIRSTLLINDRRSSGGKDLERW